MVQSRSSTSQELQLCNIFLPARGARASGQRRRMVQSWSSWPEEDGAEPELLARGGGWCRAELELLARGGGWCRAEPEVPASSRNSSCSWDAAAAGQGMGLAALPHCLQGCWRVIRGASPGGLEQPSDPAVGDIFLPMPGSHPHSSPPQGEPTGSFPASSLDKFL